MKRLLLVIMLIATSIGIGSAAPRRMPTRQGLAVVFFDEERLQTPAGKAVMADFEYFFELIEQIVKRDFPDVELRILVRGELLALPDGAHLNVQNNLPELGYVLAAPNKKHRVLGGIRTDLDFACAAVEYFRRPSAACPR